MTDHPHHEHHEPETHPYIEFKHVSKAFGDNRVLNDVDKLELQLRSKSDTADQSGQVRSTDPMPVPAGYQDAVSEYFRKLSKNP